MTLARRPPLLPPMKPSDLFVATPRFEVLHDGDEVVERDPPMLLHRRLMPRGLYSPPPRMFAARMKVPPRSSQDAPMPAR